MNRPQQSRILQDLEKKMVFLVGPRQSGKTWLAKEIAKSFSHSVYLNYDRPKDREIIKNEAWLESTDLLILDELHKMPSWKNYIKGVFDTKLPRLRILVTGSARLNTFRSGGDALSGRFFVHHLLPFSPAELHHVQPQFTIDHFIERGGFPEPFLAKTTIEADRWRSQYIDGLIREDVLDFENIHNLRAMEKVLDLLRTRVGSSVSYSSIAGDIGIAPNTVQKYIQILEALYIIFRITPFTTKIARSLLKEPKLYFFDTGLVQGDAGARFENFVAMCLLKYTYERQDYQGQNVALHYLRTKEGKEVDFCIVHNQAIEYLLETKHAKTTIAASLHYFSTKYTLPAIQLVQETKREYKVNDLITVRRAQSFLTDLSI